MGRGTGMQVIASKNAEIEDLKKRLAVAKRLAAAEQLAEDQKVRVLAGRGRVQAWE
jgi:hypothetical protein